MGAAHDEPGNECYGGPRGSSRHHSPGPHADVAEVFRRSFSASVKHPIVLYGIGEGTHSILRRSSEFNVIGLMDPSTTGQTVFGRPVMSIDEVLASEATRIVIVARRANVPVIYRRIAAAADAANLPIYDIHGTRLHHIPWHDRPLPEQLLMDAQTARSAILNADAVSFDIFDTLLTRTVLDPHDVFDLAQARARVDMESGSFRRLRVAAENEMSRVSPPTLHDIYDFLARTTDLSTDSLELLRRAELEIEAEVLIPRSAVVDLYRFARSAGKPVTLISDMYLGVNELEDILTSHQIVGYERLLVSGDLGTTKYGDLYAKYREHIPDGLLVHIGDNVEADGSMARTYGLHPLTIGSPRLMLAHSPAADLDNPNATLRERVQIGMFAARAFNDPFLFARTHGRLEISDGEELGYLLLAPTVERLCAWLIRASSEMDVLLMASRDGWLPKRLLSELIEGRRAMGRREGICPRIEYLYTSRQSSVLASLHTTADVERASALGFDGSFGELLRRRFLLDANQINPEDESRNIVDARTRLARYAPAVLARAALARRRYKACLDHVGLPPQASIGLFDFASSGTTQLALERILSRHLNGFYALHLKDLDDDAKSRLTVEAMDSTHSPYAADNALLTHYLFIETVLSSPEPSVLEFNNTGQPIFSQETRDQSTIDMMLAAHAGILSHSRKLERILCFDPTDAEAESVSNLLLDLLDNRFDSLQPSVLSQTRLVDDFCNRKYEWHGVRGNER